MKLLLLSLSIILCIPLSSNERRTSSIYEQLIEVNKYWATKDVSDGLKENYIQLNQNQLIQTHLILVEKTLREKSTLHLTSEQRKSRAKSLKSLKAYALSGKFPINLYHTTNTPYFIDDFGTACAVGQLLVESNYEQLALSVKKTHNYSYIEDLNSPALNYWAEEHGFTKEELMWIQPTYYPYCPLGTKKDAQCHDATGCINPDYEADGLIPPFQEIFEFNDGSGWTLDTNGWIMQWQGARIGDHRITVTDSMNSVKVYNYTINNAPEMVVNSVTTPQNGINCNGSVSISIQNGKPPYSIRLISQSLNYGNLNDSTGDFYNLCSGMYLAIVNDKVPYCQKRVAITIENITGIEGQKLANSNIYPNPFKEKLSIELANPLNVTYTIYSITGALVKEGRLSKNEESINTENLNSGVYFIDILNNGNHHLQKIIKSD